MHEIIMECHKVQKYRLPGLHTLRGKCFPPKNIYWFQEKTWAEMGLQGCYCVIDLLKSQASQSRHRWDCLETEAEVATRPTTCGEQISAALPAILENINFPRQAMYSKTLKIYGWLIVRVDKDHATVQEAVFFDFSSSKQEVFGICPS